MWYMCSNQLEIGQLWALYSPNIVPTSLTRARGVTPLNLVPHPFQETMLYLKVHNCFKSTCFLQVDKNRPLPSRAVQPCILSRCTLTFQKRVSQPTEPLLLFKFASTRKVQLGLNTSPLNTHHEVPGRFFINKTSQELRMLSPSLFIQGSQCKC